MIERQFVAQRIKEFEVLEFIKENMKQIGHSMTKLQRTPLGEKILVYTSRPGLLVGKKGQNIKKLTLMLKKKFNLQNPQIETVEVLDIYLDANIVAEMIASSFERYGAQRFKGIGHQMMSNVIGAGAIGVEIVIGGRGVPSTRAKSWRFYMGYLKKCGDIAVSGVKKAQAQAQLKSGVIGIKVSIMPPDIRLPDYVELKKEPETIVESVDKKQEEEVKEEKKKTAKKKQKKKASGKKVKKDDQDQGTEGSE